MPSGSPRRMREVPIEIRIRARTDSGPTRSASVSASGPSRIVSSGCPDAVLERKSSASASAFARESGRPFRTPNAVFSHVSASALSPRYQAFTRSASAASAAVSESPLLVASSSADLSSESPEPSTPNQARPRPSRRLASSALASACVSRAAWK